MGMHRVLRHLDLSDAQRDQVSKIFHDQSPAMHERIKRRARRARTLEKLGFRTGIRPRARPGHRRHRGEGDRRHDVLRAESMARVRELLTPRQRAPSSTRCRDHRR